mgnify:CR=1 FL=1
MPRISLRLTREQYEVLKELVEEGVYSSMSDVLREAVVKLLKEQRVHVAWQSSRSRSRATGSEL